MVTFRHYFAWVQPSKAACVAADLNFFFRDIVSARLSLSMGSCIFTETSGNPANPFIGTVLIDHASMFRVIYEKLTILPHTHCTL